MAIWISRNAYSLHDLNLILFSSSNSDVLFPANSESFHKRAALWIARYLIVWQPRDKLFLYTSNFLVTKCSFASYSWYIFLLIALQLKVSTNTRYLLTLYRFVKDENTVLPQLASCQMITIIRWAIPIHIQNTWVSRVKTTYITHEPVACDVLFKAPLTVQYHSNCA